MSITLPDDEFTELHDAVVPRVDLVGKGANGMPFLIAKGAAEDHAGILTTDFVRTLINDHQEQPVTTVTKADETLAADTVVGGDAPLPDADTLNADAATGADGSGVPTDAPGDPDDPKSAAWEAVDAARARQALQLTVALQRLVTEAQDRETQESAVSGDEADYDNAWSLSDVLDCLDEVLQLLAPFAVTEQAAADQMSADDITKAGRALSAANEKAIRGAADALQNVLATLPAATPDDGQMVEKESTVQDTTTAPTGTAPTAPAAAPTVDGDVTKAAGDPMQPVYDAAGKLVGMIDPTSVVPIAPAAEGDADDAPNTDATGAPAPDVATIPGTDTVQAPVQKNEHEDQVTKAVAASLAIALGEALTPLAKQFEQNVELAAVVKGLQESVEKMSREPDNRRSPIVGGGTGTPGLAQRDGTQVDPHADLRKAAATATGAAKTEADMALALAVIKGHPTVTGQSPWAGNAADVTARFQG